MSFDVWQIAFMQGMVDGALGRDCPFKMGTMLDDLRVSAWHEGASMYVPGAVLPGTDTQEG